jgi:hypothetical protein
MRRRAKLATLLAVGDQARSIDRRASRRTDGQPAGPHDQHLGGITMKYITQRPSAALVISLLALVLASAGGAFAASGTPLTTGVPSRAYEVFRNSGPLNIPSTSTRVATLSGLPAGPYVITAKAYLDISTTNGDPRVLCQVNAAGDNDIAAAQGEQASGGPMTVPMQVEVTHTFTATGTVSLTCNKNGTSDQVNVNWAKIIATSVASETHRAVTG